MCEGSNVAMDKATLENMKDIPVGGHFFNRGGCADMWFWNVGGMYELLKERGFTYPENGEFEYDHTNLGDACQPCWSRPQYKGTIKRRAFLGDAAKCCVSGNNFEDGKTCDPSMRDLTSSSCHKPMTDFCSKPENATSARCTEWLRKSENEQSLRAMDEYCSKDENIQTDRCIQFCSENKRSACDTSAKRWCDRHPSDTEFCGCLNTDKFSEIEQKLQENGMSLIPSCHISACTTNPKAYKPVRDRSVTCPDLQLCLQSIDIQGVGGEVEMTNVNFSCNQDTQSLSLTSKLNLQLHTFPQHLVNQFTASNPSIKWEVFMSQYKELLLVFGVLLFILLLVLRQTTKRK